MELAEWQAYERATGTLGPERLDILVAHQMALLANTVRDSKSTPQPYAPADFLVKWGPRKPQSWQDMKAMAKALTAQYGGTITTD